MKNFWGGHLIKNINIYPNEVQYLVPNIRWNRKAKYESDKLYYVHEGEFLLMVDDNPYIVRQHQMVLLPSGRNIAYSTNSSKNLKLYCVSIFAETDGMNLFKYLDLSDDNHVVLIQDYKFIEECFEDAIRNDYYSVIDSYHLNRASELLRITAIYIENRLRDKTTDTFFNPIISYMEDHLNENISLEKLADMVYLNPSYFGLKFKKTFHISPLKYFNELRIRTAVKLLVNTDLTLKDIALKIGIDNPYYFSYFFKEFCGESPAEYRKMFKEMHNLPVINELIR